MPRPTRPCAPRWTQAAAEGWPALHAELARVDPVTAARLAPGRQPAHPARAGGLWLSGRPMSRWQQGY
jgi:tRNA dimethylallyltransferase